MAEDGINTSTTTVKVGASGAVGRGTAPRDGRYRVRFPVQSLEKFQVTYSFGDPFSLSKKRVPRNFPGGKVRPARRAETYDVLVVPNAKVRGKPKLISPL